MQFKDASFDPDGADSIVGWSWEIEDGALDNEALTSQNPQYLFADNGTYPVTLTVESSDGTFGSTTVDVPVDNVAPKVNALNVEALPGVAAPVVARFADPGWLDSFTDDVTLGGSPVSGTLLTDNNPAYASGLFEGTASSNESSEGVAEVTDDDGDTGADGYDFEIVADNPARHEPNDAIGDAPLLASDWSHLSYIQTPGDVDLFEVNMQPGGELLVTLRDVPADYDLVLLSMTDDDTADPGDSGEASFATTPFTRSPFTRSPFTRSPFTRSPFTRSPFTRSPFTRSGFSFAELPLSQLAFTGLEGDEIIGTDIGLGELGLSLIEAEDLRIAGFSAKRGTATETALARTTTAGERMFIAVVGHNNEFESAAPYRLQVEVSQPLDLEALLGSAACTGTPLVPSAVGGATLFSGPTAGPRTLFVTQRERMIAVHGQAAFDAMMVELELLAGHAAVGGDIISLPSGIYDAWDQQPCSTSRRSWISTAGRTTTSCSSATTGSCRSGVSPTRRRSATSATTRSTRSCGRGARSSPASRSVTT
jgi:PKD repeat protein